MEEISDDLNARLHTIELAVLHLVGILNRRDPGIANALRLSLSRASSKGRVGAEIPSSHDEVALKKFIADLVQFSEE